VLVKRLPGTLNHTLAKLTVLLQSFGLGLTGIAEVAEDFVHDITIAWFGCFGKGANRPPRYG
jgi:hypothetical protein